MTTATGDWRTTCSLGEISVVLTDNWSSLDARSGNDDFIAATITFSLHTDTLTHHIDSQSLKIKFLNVCAVRLSSFFSFFFSLHCFSLLAHLSPFAFAAFLLFWHLIVFAFSSFWLQVVFHHPMHMRMPHACSSIHNSLPLSMALEEFTVVMLDCPSASPLVIYRVAFISFSLCPICCTNWEQNPRFSSHQLCLHCCTSLALSLSLSLPHSQLHSSPLNVLGLGFWVSVFTVVSPVLFKADQWFHTIFVCLACLRNSPFLFLPLLPLMLSLLSRWLIKPFDRFFSPLFRLSSTCHAFSPFPLWPLSFLTPLVTISFLTFLIIGGSRASCESPFFGTSTFLCDLDYRTTKIVVVLSNVEQITPLLTTTTTTFFCICLFLPVSVCLPLVCFSFSVKSFGSFPWKDGKKV